MGQMREIVNLDGEGRMEDRAMVPAVPVQKVATKYTTAMAVQSPRVLAHVERRSLEEAALLGSDAFYAWGQGKDRIEGPSKELAMALVRCYGNCAVDLGEIQETRDAWIFTATFVDLETGFTLARQFRQSKEWQVFGKFDAARKDDIRFQIGQSKAVRNVILNAVPGWLVKRALDRAKGGVREKIEGLVQQHGLEKVVGVCLDKLNGLGVPEPRVLTTMGRALRGALTVEDLVILHGCCSALESGADTIDVLFPLPPEAGKAPEGGSRAAQALDKLKGADARQPLMPEAAAEGQKKWDAEHPEPKTDPTPEPKAEKPKGIGDANAEPPPGTLLGDAPAEKPRKR